MPPPLGGPRWLSKRGPVRVCGARVAGAGTLWCPARPQEAGRTPMDAHRMEQAGSLLCGEGKGLPRAIGGHAPKPMDPHRVCASPRRSCRGRHAPRRAVPQRRGAEPGGPRRAAHAVQDARGQASVRQGSRRPAPAERGSAPAVGLEIAQRWEPLEDSTPRARCVHVSGASAQMPGEPAHAVRVPRASAGRGARSSHTQGALRLQAGGGSAASTAPRP